MFLNPIAVDELVRWALLEDIGPGDLTSEAIISPERTCTALIVPRKAGVFCGHPIAQAAFRALDPAISYEILLPEGNAVEARQPVARVSGNARSILAAERVVLNLVQRMSGIATTTRRLTESIKGSRARLVETRKTTPGLRMVEKYAVRVGGGLNHRYGLHDAVLIKDNHIAVAGGLKAAIAAAREYAPHTSRVEVEVDSLEQLQEALELGAEAILLDNFDIGMMRQAVVMNRGRAVLEASGGITARNLEEVARTGVDIISMGALTHSVEALDIGLDIAL